MVSRQTSPKNKRIKWFIIGVIAVIIMAVGIRFYIGYREIKKMDNRITELESEISRLQEEKQELNSRIEAVNSKEFVEKMARQKLGLLKEGELLYITVEDNKE
jgi:cell division protein FtsB